MERPPEISALSGECGFIPNNIPYYVREEDNITTNDMLARLLSVLKVKHKISLGQQVDPHGATNTVNAFFRYVTEHQAVSIERFFRDNPDYAKAITSPGMLPVPWTGT